MQKQIHGLFLEVLQDAEQVREIHQADPPTR